MISVNDRPAAAFEFERDTFAYANELVWDYHLDPQTGIMRPRSSQQAPTYTHRCFVMVRSARQFRDHARFDPAQPVAPADTYRRLIREVVSRSPRHASADPDRVVVPGYDCLRAFSRAQTPVLMATCGGVWQSYMLRSHWRMILPVWRGHQAQMAAQLARSLAGGRQPIVHLFRFPKITINHGVILYGVTETADGLRFEVYDPNIPDRPTELTYRRAERTFHFPRNHYWAGGPANVVETYCGWLY
jgi:hypothetical protein